MAVRRAAIVWAPRHPRCASTTWARCSSGCTSMVLPRAPDWAPTSGSVGSTVADLVQELRDRGLAVEERGTAHPDSGRPSPVVGVRPEGAVVLSVELTIDALVVAAVGLGGMVLGGEPEEMGPPGQSPRQVADRVARLARELAERLPGGFVTGVGIAVPGLVRRSDGFVHLAPNLGWADVPLGALVSDALDVEGCRIRVANEADLGALGEHRRGAGRGQDNLVFVSGGVGIGVGLILDGRPMLGARGLAGAGRSHPRESSWRALLVRQGGVLGRPRPASGAGRSRWAASRGRALVGGGSRQPVVNLLNPDVVVLGGWYAPIFDQLAPGLASGIGSRALAQSRDAAAIVPSALGRSAQVHGAAELCLTEILANPTVLDRR